MIDMYDCRKRRVFHVNMLKEWHVPNSVSYFSSEEGEGDSGSEMFFCGMMEEELQSWGNIQLSEAQL